MINRIFTILFLMLCTFKGIGQDYKEWMNASDVKVSDIIANAEAYLTANPNKKERKLFERWKYNAVRQQNEDGYLRKQENFIKDLRKFIQEKEVLATNKSLTGTWQELGPTNWTATSGYNPGVGRITTFAQNPTNANTMIAGSETGGIWKTTNLGTTWMPLLDNYTSMKVYALAIDPTTPSIYYWGSDEGKIYKSTDSGVTWANIATITDGSNVNKILIHPSNSSKLFASVEETGLFRSDNGGATWTSITTDDVGFDVEFKPSDPNTVYASGSSFHKSTDGGNTWTTIAGFDDTGAKMIGVSAADATKVYVVEADENSSTFNGIYESTNSGASFTKKSHPGKNYFGYEQDASDTDGQAPRDMGIAVSPTNANEVHIAGIITFRSMDGGTSFSPTSTWSQPEIVNDNTGYCHADVDDLAFAGSTLVAVSDGGIFFANNSSGTISPTFYTDKTTGMGIHQFYKIGVSQTSSAVITGGAQDNGTSTYVGSTWKNWIGADGMESFVDKTNTNILYGTQQEGALLKSTDGGLTSFGLTQPAGETGNWVTPFEQDPSTANTIYTGYKKVYKSTDGGGTWTVISQDFGAALNHLKIAPSNNNIMFVALGGSLYKTTTGSGTWSALSGYTGEVNSIAIHPTDPNKIAIATTGNGKVYVSTNGGSTWTAKSSGLPDFSALCVSWQNNTNNGLYLGMDYGIFYIEDGFSSWVNFSNQLPNVMINELEINTANSKIYAGTYGRGVWQSDLYSAASLPIELGEFHANLEDKEVRLSWHTLSEINNDYFLVQKSSDGVIWEDLDRVASNGNSSNREDYEMMDNHPFVGLNYYRLVDVDLNDKKQYSKVVSVNLTGVDLLSIYPNPSKGRFLLYMDAVKNSAIEILVYNSSGRLVKSENKTIEVGLNKIPLDVDANAGIYFLTMMVDGIKVYDGKRLVIQK